ncbi:hypothetical protein PZE23_26675, partial [Escherichia coli]|nr:hypothetical protein [Escherichia coli]
LLTLQVHWLAEKPDGNGICCPFAIFPVRTVLPDALLHVPDWHWPPCQSGVWKKGGGIGKVSSYQLNFPYSQSNLGQHTFCALSHVRATGFHNSNDYSECSLSKSGSNWQLTAYPPSIASYRCDAVCID